jgi:hypothetical protein
VSAGARLKALLSGQALYLAWLVASALGLWIARATDPYVLGAAAFLAAGISASLAVAALFFGARAFALALLASLPTVASFWLLSTYSWN